MSKQTTPLSVMKVAPIEDGSYSLKHKLDTVTQQEVTDSLALELNKLLEFNVVVPSTLHSTILGIQPENNVY